LTYCMAAGRGIDSTMAEIRWHHGRKLDDM
jgi:hypothetical protein